MRRLVLPFAVVALAAVLVTPSALASAPTITRSDFIDLTWVERRVCDFPVELHATAYVVTHLWEDADGNLRIIEVYPQDRYVITNLKTRESYSFVNSGPWFYVLDPADWTSTETGGGSFIFGMAPEPPYEPGLYRSRGHWVWVLDAGGNELYWTWVGKVDDLCQRLAP